MSWSTLSLNPDRLTGIAPAALYSKRLGGIDPERITQQALEAAKGEVRVRLMAEVSEARNHASGIDGFFDALAAESAFADTLQHALAYAFLVLYYRSEALSEDDPRIQRSIEAHEGLRKAISGVATHATSLIDLPTPNSSLVYAI